MAPELVRNGPRPGHGFGAGEQRVQFFQGACSFRAGLEANARPGSQVASKNMSNDPALGCSSLPVGGGWAFRILNGHVGTWEALLPPRIQSGTVYDQQLSFSFLLGVNPLAFCSRARGPLSVQPQVPPSPASVCRAGLDARPLTSLVACLNWSMLPKCRMQERLFRWLTYCSIVFSRDSFFGSVYGELVDIFV